MCFIDDAIAPTNKSAILHLFDAEASAGALFQSMANSAYAYDSYANPVTYLVWRDRNRENVGGFCTIDTIITRSTLSVQVPYVFLVDELRSGKCSRKLITRIVRDVSHRIHNDAAGLRKLESHSEIKSVGGDSFLRRLNASLKRSANDAGLTFVNSCFR